MKTVLILHTCNASRRRHFAAARAYGCRLVLLMQHASWETEFVNRVEEVDTSDIAATVAAVRRLAETETIDGVVTFVEHSVPSAAAAAAAVGANFVSQRSARLARDKFAMRKALQAGGVPNPRFALARDLAEARRACLEVTYPVVLKPLLGGGSMYIRRISDEGELKRHFHALQRGAWEDLRYDPLYRECHDRYGNALLVEQYLPGGELSVESLVFDGQTHCVAIHDKPLPMEGPYFEERYSRIPTMFDQSIQQQVAEATAQAHRALEIDVGATHTEFRITDEGPVILETAARLGGGPIFGSVLLSLDFDMVRAVIDLALGRRPELPSAEPRIVGSRLIFAEREGKIEAIRGLVACRELPGVAEVEVYVARGDYALLAPRAFQAHGHMFVLAEDYESLEQRIQQAISCIHIELEPQAARLGDG